MQVLKGFPMQLGLNFFQIYYQKMLKTQNKIFGQIRQFLCKFASSDIAR